MHQRFMAKTITKLAKSIKKVHAIGASASMVGNSCQLPFSGDYLSPEKPVHSVGDKWIDKAYKSAHLN